MSTVTSPDGTTIAYERTGSGPAIVLVDGAMCYRGAGPMGPLAERLSGAFTVYTYDRRGRGESADTLPYATGREVEDLQAVIGATGGAAHVYAISSGVALVLATVAAGARVDKLALYEPPFLGEEARNKEYTERLHELLEADRRGDAVALFMTHVGVPAPVIEGMRSGPGFAAFEAIAPTLAYDDTLLNGGIVPRELAATVTVPALVLAGGASPVGLRQAAQATADAIPSAAYRILDGQTHDVNPDALAPVLTDWFHSGLLGSGAAPQ